LITASSFWTIDIFQFQERSRNRKIDPSPSRKAATYAAWVSVTVLGGFAVAAPIRAHCLEQNRLVLGTCVPLPTSNSRLQTGHARFSPRRRGSSGLPSRSDRAQDYMLDRSRIGRPPPTSSATSLGLRAVLSHFVPGRSGASRGRGRHATPRGDPVRQRRGSCLLGACASSWRLSVS
jgi:hypothetical protein